MNRYLIPIVAIRFELVENTNHASNPGQPVHQAGSDVRITRIWIDYVYHTNFHRRPPGSDFVGKRYKTSHWELLISTLSALPHLREVTFGFSTPSTPDDLLKAHGSTMERLLHHDQLTVKCRCTQHKYDPVEGRMEWHYTKLDVKAKVLEVPGTTASASDALETDAVSLTVSFTGERVCSDTSDATGRWGRQESRCR